MSDLRVFDPEEWPGRVAAEWAARLEAAPGLRMVVPAGETPRPVYQRLVADGGSWARATVFLLDEFVGLPVGHPQRCDTMLAPYLERLGVSDPVRLDPGTDDLEGECRRYRERVDDGGLDLVVLGLGGNGHVGLNEPPTSPASPTRVVDLAPDTIAAAARYGGANSPRAGLTLGLSEILAAREVWLLVTGSHKRSILEQVLEGPVDDDVPATHLRGHSGLTVWVDRDAYPAG